MFHSLLILVQFDNVPAGLIDGAPIRGLNELGSHEGLYYSNMGVISATPLLAGLNAQSRPNVLAYDVLADLQGKQEVSNSVSGTHPVSLLTSPLASHRL